MPALTAGLLRAREAASLQEYQDHKADDNAQKVASSAATGVIWSACYLLWMYQRVFFGQVRHDVNATLPDLNLREKTALAPIAIAALVMGIAPLLWLNAIDPAVQAALGPFRQLASKMVGQ